MKIYSVSELTNAIKELLEKNYPDVWVSGEISNFKAHHNGHFYFNLKDTESRLAAVMFRGSAYQLPFQPEDGLAVVCLGRITVYPPYGNYQMVVEAMEPKGLGALQLAFEQLKEKLALEGLFAEERKKALPTLPRRIGVVTSRSGAVIRDIIKVARRRFPNIEILLAPTAVQGSEAAAQIAAAIQKLNRQKDVDVIIVGRGGGSMEDLWAFNEERVARAIAASKVPIISAVGHETDFTIADFVADVRAPTPSAAAELAVPHKQDLLYTLFQWRSRMHRAARQHLDQLEEELLGHKRQLKEPRRRLEEMLQRLDDLSLRGRRALQYQIQTLQMRWERLHSLLDNLSPLAILARGYCIASAVGSNQPMTSTKEVEPGDALQLRLAQGALLAVVQKTF